MRKILKIAVLFGLGLAAGALTAQTTTYTGIIKDLSLNPVTSGQVTFTLAPATSATIAGTGALVPSTIDCNINSDGSLSGYVSGVVSGACIVASNTAINPTGTSYRICIQPQFSTPGSCFYDYATTTSKDISTVAPTLSTGPINYGGVPGPQGPAGTPGSPGVGCGTGNCAVTNPSATQTITQPAGTALNIVGTLESNGTPITTLAPLGTLFNATSFTSGAGFTNNGGNPTIVSNALQFTGGVNGFANSFDLNQYTTLPQWSMTAKVVVGTVTSTSYGLGFGIRSYNSGGAFVNAVASLYTASGANQGFLFLYAGSTNIATSPTALSFSSGDTIQVTVTRNFDTLTATASDLTTNSAPVSASYQYLYSYPQANLSPNRGRFAIFNLGGTQSVTALNVATNAPVNAPLMCVGDSKTVGYYGGTFSNNWCSNLPIQTVAEAGGSDQTADVLAVIPEIISLKPHAVILNIGRNDIGAGVSFSVYSANYASIVSQLQAAGITVYHLLPIYETVASQSPLTSFINSTYPTANIVDAGLQNYSATASTVLAPDGIHPNIFGHQVIARAVTNFLANLQTPTRYTSYRDFLTSCLFQPIGLNFYCPFTQPITPARILLGQLNADTSGTYNFSANSFQTSTSANQRVGTLAQTIEATNPFALAVEFTGSATAASREYILQTEQDGLSNSGILAFNPFGGNVWLGTTTFLAITGSTQCLHVDTFGNVTGSGADCNTNITAKASFTTTATTSETVPITGMTSSGHCSMAATNTSAAANIATSYIQGKGANAITLVHVATSGMTYDFLCTPN